MLAVACVNVAGLQLGRASRRSGELRIRAALGAGFWRLARLLVLESIVVALAGAGVGLIVAWAILAWIGPMAPVRVPDIGDLILNGSLLATCFVAAIFLGLAIGLAPALGTSGVPTRSDSPHHRLRRGLVVTELAMSLVLLVGAGLFLQSFYRLARVDAGITNAPILTARVSIPRAEYAEPDDRMRFFERLHERLNALPGVVSAGLSSHLPLTGSPGRWRNSFHRPEFPPATPSDQVSAYLRWVSPGYFEAMGVSVVAGRNIEESDDGRARPVTLIDEAMAAEFFAGEDPIGKTIVVEYNDWEAEIVGVVGNTRQASLRDRFEPHIYLPYRQTYEAMFLSSMMLALRTEGDPAGLTNSLREALAAIDPQLALRRVETLDARVASSLDADRFRLVLVAGFATVALALALVGLYSVLAFLAEERRREVGVRMAVGARARDIVLLLVAQGAPLVGVGIVTGLLGVAAMGRVLKPFLFGVDPTHAPTVIGITVLLAMVATAASWAPARSATRVDPVSVLRHE